MGIQISDPMAIRSPLRALIKPQSGSMSHRRVVASQNC